MRKGWLYLGVLAVVLLAAALLAGPVQTWHAVAVAQRQFRAGTPSQKRSALRDLARLRSPQGDAVVRAALADRNADTRNDATYAIGTSHRTDLAGDLRAAWQREPDRPIRGGMIYYWAQLAGPAAEPALRPMLASEDPWTALGAAKGLLRLGDLEAGEQVLSLAAGPDADLCVDARKELQSLAGPMAGMIGQKLEIADVRPVEWTVEQTARFQAWWRVHVTPRLLRDYLAWRNDKPDQWRKADLLLHEWKSRFGGFLRMSEAPGEVP